MRRALVYTLYNVLLPFVLLLGLPSFLLKGLRRGGLARNFRQRLGFLSRDLLAPLQGQSPLWIHAVSVGEVFIALKLVEAIRVAAPDLSLVLSTTTTTGYRVAAEKRSPGLTVIHNPVDLPLVAWSVLRQLEPRALVLVESEIWPNLVGLARLRGIPVLLANARLSPRSERRYRRVSGLVAPIFSLLDGLTVPYDDDRTRWADLGIDPGIIETTGSIKFDHAGPAAATPPLRDELAAWLAATACPAGARLLVGGSTHEGEERLLARLLRRLREEFPDLALVLVPRHAERGPDVAVQMREEGLSPVLRVAPGASPEEDSPERVWIANTTGELRSWYELAELVVIGKSFCGEGGQNPVEPILAGRPVVVGPHMENFAEVVAALRAVDGIHQVADEEELARALAAFLRDPALGEATARRGSAAMANHAHAAARNAEWILRHLPA